MDCRSVENINELPAEMLAKVFGFLNKYSDRDRAVQVCPQWSSVIHETVGVRKYIGNGSEFWYPETIWTPLTDIYELGVSRCFFSDVRTEINAEIAGFLRPSLVGHVEFDGFIPQELFEAIIKPLWKLRVLAVHLSTLSLVDISFLNSCSLVNNLNKLCLTSEGFSVEHFKKFEMEPVYLNMLRLLNIYFPNLKTFHSSLPLILDMEIELFTQFADFFSRHGKTLQEITLKANYRWRINTRSADRRTLQELDEINERLATLEQNQQFQQIETCLPRDLKYLCFIIEDRRIVYPTSLGIRTMMLFQTKLIKLYYLCWDYMEIPAKLIAKNCTTLTEIGLTVNDVTNGPVDCTVFAQCLLLRKLLIEADGEYEFNDVAADAPRLQNTQVLPKSLTNIVFRNVYIESSSVETIAKGLPKLESLFLTNIGKEQNLGMGLSCLLWILKENLTIRKLKVKGLNEKSFKCVFATYWKSTGDSDLDDTIITGGLLNPLVGLDFDDWQDFGDSLSENQDQEESQVSWDDQVLLDDLMEETNMHTKYIPYIIKKNGVWKRH